MIRDMAVRGFSPRTHEAYIAVVRLAKYYKRSPDQLTNDEVWVYLAYLILAAQLRPRFPAAGIFEADARG